MLNILTTFADSDCCVSTSILDGCAGIGGVLELVVNIMTAGIAVLATVGIVVSGVQYLTAGGNEEQVKKSKRRIFEIIIGLAAYAVAAALLSWLLPDYGKKIDDGCNSGQEQTTTGDDTTPKSTKPSQGADQQTK